MSGLTHRFLFGVNAEISSNIHFIDDSTILYVAGHNVVLYDQLEARQKFIHGAEKSEKITSVALCEHKKYVAVAERGEGAMINVYNTKTLRKYKTLVYEKWVTKDVIAMAFSNDNQTLLTLGGEEARHSAVPNCAMPNSAMPNSAMPNSAMPNSAMPNYTMPNYAMPNYTMPMCMPPFVHTVHKCACSPCV